ncbi:MAG: hypothetical protein WBA17_15235 [Saprospiraceae bacterium]
MSKTIDVIDDIPKEHSSAEHWEQWYRSLKEDFGRDRANYVFMLAWERRGSDAANTEELRAYLARQGITLAADWKDIAVDFAGGVVNSVGDYFGTIRRNLMIVGIIALVIVAGIVYMILKNPELAINLTPQGRALGMAKNLRR